jgi:hypothetical protein
MQTPKNYKEMIESNLITNQIIIHTLKSLDEKISNLIKRLAKEVKKGIIYNFNNTYEKILFYCNEQKTILNKFFTPKLIYMVKDCYYLNYIIQNNIINVLIFDKYILHPLLIDKNEQLQFIKENYNHLNIKNLEVNIDNYNIEEVENDMLSDQFIDKIITRINNNDLKLVS